MNKREEKSVIVSDSLVRDSGLHLFEVVTDGDAVDWFFAESIEDVTEQWRKYMVEVVGDDPDMYEMEVKDQIPDDENVTLHIDCGPDKETKTALEWIADFGYKTGWFAGSEC